VLEMNGVVVLGRKDELQSVTIPMRRFPNAGSDVSPETDPRSRLNPKDVEVRDACADPPPVEVDDLHVVTLKEPPHVVV
jgi:hypothetical protein